MSGSGDDRNGIEAKGCSCRTATGSDGVNAALLGLAGVGLLAARRRRRSS
jgi:MYXO-CTERM domain-containing protein